MRKEKFLYFVNYNIDVVNKKMKVFYKDTFIEEIQLENNLSYNPVNEEKAHEIALNSELGKKLVKGEI